MSRAAEVVVIGAGPAGSATATLLARSGHRVVLLDRAHFPRSKACAEYASPGTVHVLERLGFAVQRGRRLVGMQLIAPGGERHLVHYRRPADERPALSLSMPRTELDACLLELARAAGVDVREGHRAEQALVERGKVRGIVARDASGNLQHLHAELVVGADGVHSMLARALRLRRRPLWPARIGLVGHLRGVNWPEDFGQMWVGRRSYVGVAPVGDGVVTVGLVTDLRRRRRPATEVLEAELREFAELHARLIRGELLEPVRGVAPLAHTVRTTCGAGFLLVGDAAGFFDPFTGEGLFRALRGAELAAEAAHRVLDDRPGGLVDYPRARRRVFGSKERVAQLIQLFVRVPALMNYAVARLQRRPRLARELALVLGDLEPADTVLRPSFLWNLVGA